MIPDHARRLLGRTLRDKWTLDAFLGEGGNAMVFAATHRNGMRGAVKILHGQHTANAETKRRLAREGYVANRIDHPGVVRVLDDDETDDGIAFIVMELLEGETWKQHWLGKSRALSLEEVLSVSAKVLRILEAAHAAEVVHRDVKPDNVFLTKSGEVKLLDFGIARLREGGAEATQTGRMLGTPAFMSPEQALARWREVDARSDVFAVGATMRALLTGRALHVYATLPELLVAAATRSVPPLRSIVPDAPPALAELIDKAVAFERDQRWASAGAMRAAVEELLASLPPERRGPLCEIDPPQPAAGAAVSTQATILAALGEAPNEHAVDPAASTLQPSTLAPTPASARSSTSDPSDPTLLSADPSTETSAASPTASTPPKRSSSAVWLVGVVAAVGVVGALIGRLTSSAPNVSQPADAALAPPTAASSLSPTASAVLTALPEPPPPSPVAEVSAQPSSEPKAEASSSASVLVRSAPPRSASLAPKARPLDVVDLHKTVDLGVQRARMLCGNVKEGPRVVPVSLLFHSNGRCDVSIPPDHRGALSSECVRSQMHVSVAPYDGPDYPMSTSVSLP